VWFCGKEIDPNRGVGSGRIADGIYCDLDCYARAFPGRIIDRWAAALRVHDVTLQVVNEGRVRQATPAMKDDVRFAIAMLQDHHLPTGLAQATESLRGAVESFDARSNPGGLTAIEAAMSVFDGLVIPSLRADTPRRGEERW